MWLMLLPDVTVDETLLVRIQQGDHEAIIAAYDRYFTPLFHYARLKIGDSATAEDVVSEVFVTLLECAGTRRAPHTHLRGWLFQVARHLIAQQHSKIRQIPLAELEEWMPAPSEMNPETAVSDLLDMQRVRRALHMLTTDHQEVLILRFGQRLSLQETADIMGKSLSAIKSLQFRAMETLRGILSDVNTEVSNA
jgi:RNA polymerase sigma-70 factor (ECF subfamily)